MNAKWYASTLIIILALLGLNQEQNKVANQQIVLQFEDEKLASESSYDEVLVSITKRLESLGITAIEIVENTNTQLSIRYYSDIDALSVKEFLSDSNDLLITYKNVENKSSKNSEDEFPENCNLVVSDLQQQVNDGLSENGKFAFELKQDYHRFSNPVVLYFNDAIGLEQDAIVDIAIKINKAIVIGIDNTSITIPQVRAGPYVNGNC